MSSTFDKLVRDLISAIKAANTQQTSPIDTQAEVIRIEGNTAWVHIPGGVDETPVNLTINARVGDIVQVRIGGGRAWLTGNASAPPTDDGVAIFARELADNAGKAAGVAHELADEANGRAKTAWDYADTAAGAADYAQGQATLANLYANGALAQLSIVENVVGALAWITSHGEYSENPTEDETIQAGKWYYIRSGSGTEADPYTYSVASIGGDDNPHALGLYELLSVDEAVSNYVSAHLAVDADGLWIQMPDENFLTKLQLSSTEGVVLWGSSGNILGKYGETAQIGNALDAHIEVVGTTINFYDVPGHRVAYISDNRLFITDTQVINRMYIGEQVSNQGKGQYAWEAHQNIYGRNNLGLRWMG